MTGHAGDLLMPREKKKRTNTSRLSINVSEPTLPSKFDDRKPYEVLGDQVDCGPLTLERYAINKIIDYLKYHETKYISKTTK